MIKNILKIANLKTVFALVLYMFFRNENKAIRAYEIKEDSMKPALLPDEFVLASKVSNVPVRGDIVIFNNTEKNIDVVKRVIGLPGEEVESQDGSILINSEIINDPWAKSFVDDFIKIQLRADEIFVLGDQRTLSSSDSRTVGPIKYSECWKIRVRYWPYYRFRMYE
jgi:signal peptidase I|tara:strand:+ start:308 stop:808 length:501 start_codon:yes stop_codon:yes gene_type:complete